MSFDLTTISIALAVGILPAILWLIFWLRQDKKRPEPRGLILLTFFGGFLAVIISLGLEKLVENFFVANSLIIIIVWSVIEELSKYGMSYFTSLRKKAMDEPIDPMIYLITTALGFAALENVLFLMSPAIGIENILQNIMTGNMRFIGATVLHTLTSGVIGLSMALSFYKNRLKKRIYLFLGIVLSISLHSAFNFFIIKATGEGIITIFVFVWIAVIALILLFEKVKKIRLQNKN